MLVFRTPGPTYSEADKVDGGGQSPRQFCRKKHYIVVLLMQDDPGIMSENRTHLITALGLEHQALLFRVEAAFLAAVFCAGPVITLTAHRGNAGANCSAK